MHSSSQRLVVCATFSLGLGCVADVSPLPPLDASASRDADLPDSGPTDVLMPPDPRPQMDASMPESGPPDATCIPQSCLQQRVECGAADDGCGNPLDCGPCGGWSDMSTLNAPSWARLGVSIWTGEDMFVFGGTTGRGPPSPLAALYNAESDTWRAASEIDAPPPTLHPCIAMVQGRVFVWGGTNLNHPDAPQTDEGGLYDPVSDTWRPTSLVDAPSPRSSAACVTIGDQVLVFGGTRPSQSNGGIYDPASDTWRAIAASPIPVDFVDGLAVEGELIIGKAWLAFDPALGTWRALERDEAPGRATHLGLAWTGEEIFTFGGARPQIGEYRDETLLYAPDLNQWRIASSEGGPSGRSPAITAWTGRDILVWGCRVGGCDDGYHFDVQTGVWTSMPRVRVLGGREPQAVWTGEELLVLSGTGGPNPQSVARRYRPNLRE